MISGTPIAGGVRSGVAEAALAPHAAPLVREVGQLRDGTPVQVRPLVAQDRALLLAGFGALSRRSRRARFLQGVSDAQFARMLPVLLDTVDQRSHVALVLCAG